MRCMNCGRELPEGSRFCQYCGGRLTEQAPPRPPEGAPRPGPIPTPPPGPGERAGDATKPGPIPTPPPGPGERAGDATKPGPVPPQGGAQPKDAPKPKPEPEPKPKKGGGGKLAFIIIAAVLIAALAGLNVYQYAAFGSTAQESADRIKQLEGEVSSKESEINSLHGQIDTLESEALSRENEMSSLRTRSDWLDEIAEFIDDYDAGYATDYFRASEALIVTTTADYLESFTLYTEYNLGMTVSYETEGSSATLEFAEDTWGSSVDLYVYPQSPGITIFTLSNDLYYDSFRVMVVVTE